MSELSTENIPYDEMRAISLLLKAHGDAHLEAVRAVIAFGSLVATGDSTDIELLEVVEGWQGIRRVEFGSTAQVPLRGLATIYFLTPQEFESPTEMLLTGTDVSSASLLRRVRAAYTVLINRPPDYVQNQFRRPTSSRISPAEFFAQSHLVAGQAAV